jgi:hypothetical protein
MERRSPSPQISLLAGAYSRTGSGRNAGHEIDLVLHRVEHVLADELPSLGDVVAEAAAQVPGGRHATRDRHGKLAIRADERAVRQHLRAVAHEPAMLTELRAAGVAGLYTGLAGIAGIWCDVEGHPEPV